MTEIGESKLIDSNQTALALQLEISLEEDVSHSQLIEKIEQKLGDKSVEEQARWFVLSVLRQISSEKWNDPSKSALDEDRQYALAKHCLSHSSFAKSMNTALKDNRCKFTLLSFARAKDLEKKILSSATNAYKIAAAAVKELDTKKQGETTAIISKSEKSPVKNTQRASKSEKAASKNESRNKTDKEAAKEAGNEAKDTVVGRRAERRGYVEESHVLDDGSSDSLREKPIQEKQKKPKIPAMSEAELSDLEDALSNSDQISIEKNWNYQTNEERWSLILGAAAGLGFFALVLILFLI